MGMTLVQQVSLNATATLDPRVNGKWVIDLFAQAIERPTHRFNRPLG
jgi:hypothetical protein